MAMPQTHGWTAEMVRALPDDGNRYEVIDGELFVTPAPSWRHGDAVLALIERLLPYLREHRIGHLKITPQDVEFDERNMVEPDLFVVPLVEGRRPIRWEDVRRLLLAVEVLSPGTARADRLRKRALYQREGVPEYWIVDADARVVERWRRGESRPEVLDEALVWHPDPGSDPLTLELPALFAEVWGE
jgi:Uma2 family endonuclease